MGKMITNFAASGGMAEWFKAAVLKTVERKLRGFESYSLRHLLPDQPSGTAGDVF
jgi:hypothetical protein